MKTKVSLIISTYNWPEALELVLLSVKHQVVYPLEVIIADDGSKEDTRFLIETFQKKIPVPLLHIWHDDVGFTKSIILNKAIAKAKGNYIIQVDGDCILHKDFVKDHFNSTEERTYLYGSRVNIQKPFIAELFESNIYTFSYLAKGIKKRNRNIHLPILVVLA